MTPRVLRIATSRARFVAMYRREALMSLLGAPLAASLLSCDEPAAPAVEGGLVGPSPERGHALRDRAFPSSFDGAPIQRVSVAILGGGPAGLSAGYELGKHGEDYALFELEPRLGGTSASDRSAVTAHPMGAHYLPLPMPHHHDLIALLEEMGAIVGTDRDGLPIGAEELLVREPEERLFHHGYFTPGLYPYSGATPADLAQLARFRRMIDRYASLKDGQGRRAFSIPLDLSSDDADLVALDRITAAQWLASHGFTSERLRWMCDYACRDDYGLGLEHTSAWALIFYHAARTPSAGHEPMPLLTWPSGNGALVEHLARHVGDRAHAGVMIVDVFEQESGVRIHAIEDDAPRVIEADRAIVAMPRFLARRVVRALRDKPDEGFTYGAWMVANLHLAERPFSRGSPPAWDNVIYDSPSLGYVTATHQRGRDTGPTVFTYYYPFTDDDPRSSRERMLASSWDDVTELVVRDLSRPHPDLAQHLRRVDVVRHAHAMVRPRPGFVWSDARRRAKDAIGRIHFAHSDLSGVALFEEAFSHGTRAAREVIAARRSLAT